MINQAMNIRIDDQQRQQARHLSDTMLPLTPDPNLQFLHRSSQPHPYRGPAGSPDLAEHDQLLGVPSNQILRTRGSKRGAAPKEVDGLEQAGLPAAIRADDKIQPRTRTNIGPLQVPEDLEVGANPMERRSERLRTRKKPWRVRGEGSLPSPRTCVYSRIGMTTYFAASLPSARIRQLLLGSESAIATFSPSIAFSASIT